MVEVLQIVVNFIMVSSQGGELLQIMVISSCAANLTNVVSLISMVNLSVMVNLSDVVNKIETHHNAGKK